MKKPTPGQLLASALHAGGRTRKNPVAGQAIRALLRLRLGKPVGLVLDVDRDLGQRLGVHATVVRTEEQLS
jgi:hypothetical protein